MEGDFIKINEWLMPLSWLYGTGVAVRNWFFDIGLLRQKSYPLPVISVGNLTVGGCGKTPHVEYLVKLLKDTTKTAVLSRGYKRKSSGYILADKDSSMPRIGDEPFQMRQKFDDIYVAVDKNRRHGIERLMKDEETRDVQAILLDDAYQHRYVKPGVNILLVDYHRLIIYDKLLPAGRLREPRSGKERADIVIVTKCPDDLKPMDYRVLTKALNLRPYQKLFFTGIVYEPLRKMYGLGTRPLESIKPDENILLFSGIASPEQIKVDMSAYSTNIKDITFSDHHQFSKKDVDRINREFADMPSPKFLLTTEKDSARLSHLDGLSEEVKQNLYVLPITIDFKLGQKEAFDENIISYVRKTNVMRNIINK